MTQKEELTENIKYFGFSLLHLQSCQRELEDTLRRAQNRPPEGEADGSITEIEWSRADALNSAIKVLIYNLKRMNGEVNWD